MGSGGNTVPDCRLSRCAGLQSRWKVLTTSGVRVVPSAPNDQAAGYRREMRPLLYVLGVLVTIVGSLKTLGTTPAVDQITGMLIVVCGVTLFSAGAISGAIESLRARPPGQRPVLPPVEIAPVSATLSAPEEQR